MGGAAEGQPVVWHAACALLEASTCRTHAYAWVVCCTQLKCCVGKAVFLTEVTVVLLASKLLYKTRAYVYRVHPWRVQRHCQCSGQLNWQQAAGISKLTEG